MAVVGEGLVMVRHEENILRFQIGMNQVEIMQDYKRPSARSQTFSGSALTSDTGEQLASEALYLAAWKWHEGVPFEEIEDALPK